MRRERLSGHDCPECSGFEPVEFHRGYLITRCGAVWSTRRSNDARRMARVVGSGGYIAAQVRHDGKHVKMYIHTLLARHFLGGVPDGMCVRHLDGDRENNRISNLAVGTHKQNAEDRERHGKTARGERNGWSTVTDEGVGAAVKLVKGGASQREAADKLGVSQSTIWRWVHGVRRVEALLAAPGARP